MQRDRVLRAPSVGAFMICLLGVRLLIKWVGLAATERLLWRIARRNAREVHGPGDALSDPGLTLVIERISIAATFVPCRAACLEQSLVLFFWLNRHGTDASLCVGIQPLPFSAHAWVEIDGRPVNCDGGQAGAFTPLQRVGR